VTRNSWRKAAIGRRVLHRTNGPPGTPELLGIHDSTCLAGSARNRQAVATGAPDAGRFSTRRETRFRPAAHSLYTESVRSRLPYGLRPQTLLRIADSPVGLAAYFLDHDAWSYALIARVFAGEAAGLTRDDVLDNVTIAW